MATTEVLSPEFTHVKSRQQLMWASGNYQAVATLIQPVADAVCEAVAPIAGSRVLDVACGSGNAVISAARNDCDVSGVDYVPALLERARLRLEVEGLQAVLLEGDAEALPFPDRSFDAVLSVFGAMFAPNQIQTAAELARVCRPGGRIGLATWAPDSFIGEVLKLVSTHVAPVPGVPSPLLWGSESHIRELFGDLVASLSCTRRTFTFRFRSAEQFVAYYRDHYGPTVKAFETVGLEGADALFADLVELVGRFAGTTDGPVAVPAVWIETVAERSGTLGSGATSEGV